MNQSQEPLQKLTGKELENYGDKIFKNIGLTCFSSLGQIKLNDITSGYLEDEHIELDYIIPHHQVCLVGEITARDDNKNIKEKYDKFKNQINILKNIEFTEDFWRKLNIQDTDIRYFREINSIKAFFITTKKERFDVNISNIENIVIFYKSDFLRIVEYSKSIGRWAKNYFINNFNIDNSTSQAITIYEKDNLLIINKNKKISSKNKFLSDLYTFAISPYDLLDIAHVHRKDELPSLQDNLYNYQRLLNTDKLKAIRKNLLNDPDFMFPSSILVILSQKCKYTKDGAGDSYLYIPKKYRSVSVIDGQHRLFSYADEDVKSKMQDDCQIQVTAIDFRISNDCEIISKFSAELFIEINTNQTRVEISHLDQIAYELGSDDPKVIATKIVLRINSRSKFSSFFDLNSDNLTKGIVEAGTIIDAIKKITNIRNIKRLENAKSDKNKLKKLGYENLFESTTLALSQKETLVEEGIIVFERYFNEIFSVFKHDKLIEKKKKNESSFVYSKFWAGFVNLLGIFLEDGLDWNRVRNELNKIKDNVMKLRHIDEYREPLFDSKDPQIPDAKYSPTKTCEFLNKNRKEPTSIQNL